MRSIRLAAAMAAALVFAVPAVAAPVTLSCGPFAFTRNGAPDQVNAIKVVIDPAVRSASIITPTGERNPATSFEFNEYVFRIDFIDNSVMRDASIYVLSIDRDNANASLALYPNMQQPFAQSRCAQSMRIGH